MLNLTVGIPTVNGPHRLERCLSHLFKDDTIKNNNIEVIVVDDGSDEYSLQTNKQHCLNYNVKLIEHNERKGVPKAWNTLCKNATKDKILLLNDDIEVNRYWAETICYSLDNNKWLGCIGLNAIEGQRPNEFPVFPTYMESKIMLGSLDSEIIAPRGYAFAFRKADWELINGFDERYFCFFEEIDFALSLYKNKKLRSGILTFPLLQHYHAETTRTVLEDPMKVFIESKLAFENKWNFKWSELRNNFKNIPLPKEIKEWNTNLEIWG